MAGDGAQGGKHAGIRIGRDPGGETDVQYLRIYVRALRQKIEADPERPVHIQTETGVGYRLRINDQEP